MMTLPSPVAGVWYGVGSTVWWFNAVLAVVVVLMFGCVWMYVIRNPDHTNESTDFVDEPIGVAQADRAWIPERPAAYDMSEVSPESSVGFGTPHQAA